MRSDDVQEIKTSCFGKQVRKGPTLHLENDGIARGLREGVFSSAGGASRLHRDAVPFFVPHQFSCSRAFYAVLYK